MTKGNICFRADSGRCHCIVQAHCAFFFLISVQTQELEMHLYNGSFNSYHMIPGVETLGTCLCLNLAMPNSFV